MPRYQRHMPINIYKRCMKLLMIILWPCQETDKAKKKKMSVSGYPTDSDLNRRLNETLL